MSVPGLTFEVFADDEGGEALAKRNSGIPQNLPKVDQHWLFVAQTVSGKSVAIVNLLATIYREVFDKIYLCHSQYDDDPVWHRLDIPKKQIEKEYKDEWLDKILADLDAYRKKKKGDAHYLLVLDDQMAAWRGSKKLNETLTWCRHRGLAVWTAVQYAKGAVSKLSRAQMSAITCWPSNLKDQDEKVIAELSPVGQQAFFAAVEAVRKKNSELGIIWGSLTMSVRDPAFPFAYNFTHRIRIEDERPRLRKSKATSSRGGAEDSDSDDEQGLPRHAKNPGGPGEHPVVGAEAGAQST
jgi:hypothetical protein